MRINLRNVPFVLLSGIFFVSFSGFSQVGVNTTTPNDAAALDVSSTNKGVLFPRVSLSGTNDNTTITSPSAGLLVYNTNTDGSGGNEITPGYFYWSGSKWRRLFNEGYTLEYEQTSQVSSSAAGNYVPLPGMDTGTFRVPFTGEYQIIVTGYMAVGNIQNTGYDGAAQGCFGIRYRTGGGGWDVMKENYLTSSAKRVQSTSMNNLGRSSTIVLNVSLQAGVDYRFQVYGRRWLTNNISSNLVYFGLDTSGFSGSGGVNDAMRSKMTITLIRQI